MSDYVIVAFKVPREKANAYLTIFPNAKIIDKGEKKTSDVLPNPTLEEVLEFCKQRNSPVDGTRFFKYYDGRGWIDNGGRKVDNWQKKLVEWESNGKNNKQSPNNIHGGNHTGPIDLKDLYELSGKAQERGSDENI